MFIFTFTINIYLICVFLFLVVIEGETAIVHPSTIQVGPKPKQNIQQFQLPLVLPHASSPQEVRSTNPNPGYFWVQIPSTFAPTQVQKKEPQCPKPRGQFPSDVCNMYINCWDGVAVKQSCPEGLLFNIKGYCDYPQNVNCGGKPIEGIPPPVLSNPTVAGQSSSAPTPPTSTTTTSPIVIATLPSINPNLRSFCLKPRGQFRSNSCNKYVNCWDDVIVEQVCPEGLVFSDKGYCDYPNNVDCRSSSSPNVSYNNKEGGSIEIEKCPLDFGTFRERNNCSNYYTCIGGQIAAQYSCPQGFKFNDNLGVCDYENRVDCSKPPLIFSPKSNFLANIPKDFMNKIYNCVPGSVLPLNPQCTIVGLCREGLSEIVQCPSRLTYNSMMDKCVLPHLASCT